MNPRIRKPFEGDYPLTFDFGEAPEWYIKVAGFPHNGLDFGLPTGTPVLACDEGFVIYADNIPDSDGMGLILSHYWGISLYWHLSEITAKLGHSYGKGAIIGKSGATGWATGPHLHFAIKVKGDEPAGMRGWSDPKKYFSEPLPQEQQQTQQPHIYEVIPGDSLWKIAEKFYGNGAKWRLIYEANKDKIKNPNLIYPYQKLIIP
jgi:murein DD-endopeptidase MepM/ murein hydrolase activator NlpD